MRAQHFHYIADKGAEQARALSSLAEDSHDPAHSAPHRKASELLSSRMQVEAAKLIASMHADRATGRHVGGPGKVDHKAGGSDSAGEDA